MNGVRKQSIALQDKRYQESMMRLGRKAARDDPHLDLAKMMPCATPAQIEAFTYGMADGVKLQQYTIR